MNDPVDSRKNTTCNPFAIESTGHDDGRRQQLRDLHDTWSGVFPTSAWNATNSMLFSNRVTLSRALYFNERYKGIVGIPGMICEFGVLYGGNLSLLINLRGIYEPYHYLRRIVGFDTFTGFTHDLIDAELKRGWSAGDYSTPEGYEDVLHQILTAQEANSPISHLQKFELVKGDVTNTFDTWLDNNPSAIIAMAIFDMDVYAPTKHVLDRVLDRIPKGGMLCFDELNFPAFPGETIALRETLGLTNLRLRHDPHNPARSWCIIE